METILNIPIPVEYIVEKYNGKEYHLLVSNDETKKLLDIPIVVQADSKEEAINQFWLTVKSHLNFLETRRHQADKWEPFKIGPWKHIGGKWIRIFGHHINFRYGKRNKGGWFIPFTQLNISYHNQWKNRKK